MAIDYWHNCSILEGGLEIAGHAKNFVVDVTVNPLDVTAMDTTGWTELIGGLKTGTMSCDFMQDLADDSLDENMWANFGTSGVARSFVTNSADGSVAFLMSGTALSYTPITGNVGDLAMGRISSVPSSSPLVRGQLIHPGSASRTSSSTGTAYQTGAVVAGKRMYAALHVLSASGTSPTLDVIVQSDNASNFPSATNRITFTQATAASAQFSSVAGAITDDYWRVSYTIGGSATPTFAFAVTIGVL